MISLRPYQSKIVSDLRESFRIGNKAPILVAPTGSGKTVIFSFMAAESSKRGNRIVILVHRDELLQQVSGTLAALNVPHGFIAAGYYYDPRPLVHVASVQTVARRIEHIAVPNLVVIDEAHHAIGTTTWGRVLQAWSSALRIGVTATPARLSGEGLKECFDSMVLGPSVEELIRLGALSPYRIFAPTTVDLSGVHTRMGDYATNELLRVMDQGTVLSGAVQHYRQLCDDKRAVAFTVSIEHAKHTAAQFSESGIPADVIDGTLSREQRRHIVQEFRDGRIKVLASCNVISEGFDLPSIEAAILLRPTQSLSVHLQQVGRVLRPFDDKPHAIIIDLCGNTARHGFPDDPREWTLEGRRHRVNAPCSVQVRICPACYAAVRPQDKCPFCGKVFEAKPRELEEVTGALAEIDPAIVRMQARREQSACRTREELVALGRERKYQYPVQWAERILRARHHIQQRVTTA